MLSLTSLDQMQLRLKLKEPFSRMIQKMFHSVGLCFVGFFFCLFVFTFTCSYFQLYLNVLFPLRAVLRIFSRCMKKASHVNTYVGKSHHSVDILISFYFQE